MVDIMSSLIFALKNLSLRLILLNKSSHLYWRSVCGGGGGGYSMGGVGASQVFALKERWAETVLATLREQGTHTLK